MTSTSITDIAKAAGVSPSTVSRALHDHPRISPKTRTVIRTLAQQMGYEPSQIARSLVTGRTRTLGIVITDVTDPFVAEVMKGAEQAGRELGYSLLFATSRRDPDQELLAAKLLLGRQVDGIIVVSSRAADHYTNLLITDGKPLVLINHELNNPHAHSVRTDNHQGIQQAVCHLRNLGHSRIAFVAGPEGGRSSRERLEAFQEVSRSLGLPQSAEWILDGEGLLEDGPKAFAVLSRLEHRPSAVVCYNDLTAIGLLSAANQVGLRVPEYMSVVGYDNIPLSEFTIPPLTTVDQAKEALGRTAVETCVRALSGEKVPDAVLPGVLVVRKSTGAAERANALPSRSG